MFLAVTHLTSPHINHIMATIGTAPTDSLPTKREVIKSFEHLSDKATMAVQAVVGPAISHRGVRITRAKVAHLDKLCACPLSLACSCRPPRRYAPLAF